MFPIVINLVTWLVVIPVWFTLGYLTAERKVMRLLRRKHTQSALKAMSSTTFSKTQEEETWKELGRLSAYDNLLIMLMDNDNAAWPIRQAVRAKNWVKHFRKAKDGVK
jgi:hypothetical protein